MWKDVFSGFRFLEGILLILGAVGFLTFWIRTRFWLPKYIHVLASIGLIVGVLSLRASPADAPIKRHGLIAGVLLALVLSSIIYSYFILHGGLRVTFNRSFSYLAPFPIS